MTTIDEEAAFERHFARVESLLAELSRSRDPEAERATREILATVLELHRRGLSRVLELTAREDSVREALAADPRVSTMLLLHGLHPIALGERVSRAVAAQRDRFRTKIESVELEASESAQVVVRITPSSGACGSTRESLKKDFEAALLAAAPDAEAVRVELLEPTPALIKLRVRSSADHEQAVEGSR